MDRLKLFRAYGGYIRHGVSIINLYGGLLLGGYIRHGVSISIIMGTYMRRLILGVYMVSASFSYFLILCVLQSALHIHTELNHALISTGIPLGPPPCHLH